MIRLNAASSKSSSRRKSKGGAGGGGSFRNSFKNNDGGDDGTRDDAAEKGPSSKVNRLFEELLGDGASAIGSVKGEGGGEESTAMSSVLGPILKAKGGEGGANDKEEGKKGGRKGGGGGVLNLNSSNSPALNQLNIGRQTPNNGNNPQAQPQPKAFDEETDADTFMTKPRVIAIDPNFDDVSALFGGAGGTGGVESYMGTVAAPRKNRQRGGGGGFASGGMEMFGARGNRGNAGGGGGGKRNLREEDSRHTGTRTGITGRTGATSTFQSMGVTTILEEIGMGSTLRKDKRSVDSGDDSGSGEKKGHRGSRWSGRSNSSRDKRGRHGNKGHDGPPKFSSKNLIVMVVTIMFVAVQLVTLQKHDRRVMGHMNWRFQQQKQRYAETGKGYHPPPQQPVYARPNSGGADAGRRRGAYANAGSGEDGLGDVLRKTVPLLPQSDVGGGWRKEMALGTDDGMGGGGGRNLRGGPGGAGAGGGGGMKKNDPKDDWEARKREDERKIAALNQRKAQEQKLREQQLEEEKQRQRIHQKLQKTEKQEGVIGDTHPLLKPRDGLSVESALKKLGSSTDKLSDLDPLRPQQQLSNDIVPSRFHVFADLRTPYVVGRDTPFFWHIPRSGGVVVKTMLSHCLGQTLAAEVGELEGHDKDSELKVISFSEHNYTNVNIATPQGISRALDLGLVPSHLSDTLVSAHVDLVPSLYNANDRARAFVLFRHPVDRAASMFYFLKGTGYPPLKNMTVDDYAKSPLIENNWLVRILSESMTGPINMDNLEIAKEVLRRKFIIGLLDNKRGSFARFDHYFKWKESPKYEKEFGCRKQLMDEKYVSKHSIRKDSDTWKLLLEQNRFDVHLYDFAKELFSQQSYIFGL